MPEISVSLNETVITAAVTNPAAMSASIASEPITASLEDGIDINASISSTPVTATLVNGGTVAITVTDTPVTVSLVAGFGDVVGPASAVDSNFVAFNTTTGKLIKDSGYSPSSFELADATIIKSGNASWVDLTDGGETNLHTHAASGGDISGTGVVGQVAEFVTDTKTLQAAKLIAPSTHILTLTNAAAATLALNITSGKTLTLTAADNYTLTIPATGTAALLGINNNFTRQQFVDGSQNEIQLRVQANGTQTANLQTWENSSGVVLGGVAGDGRLFYGTAPSTGIAVYVERIAANATDTALFFRNTANTSLTDVRGVVGSARITGASAISLASLQGVYSTLSVFNTNAASGITNAYAFRADLRGEVGANAVAVNSYMFYGHTILNSGTNTFTNVYGLYLQSITAGTSSNYAILTNAGNIVFNEGGDANTDFRVEGDTNQNLIFTDASADAVLFGTGTQVAGAGITLGLDVGITDAKNVILGATTGSKIGTATTQKLGFWNATPIVQPTTAVAAATFAANTSGIVDDTATFDGYTIGQVVKALRNEGLLA